MEGVETHKIHSYTDTSLYSSVSLDTKVFILTCIELLLYSKHFKVKSFQYNKI